MIVSAITTKNFIKTTKYDIQIESMIVISKCDKFCPIDTILKVIWI